MLSDCPCFRFTAKKVATRNPLLTRFEDWLLRYKFETISRMPEHKQQFVRELLDALIVKSQVAGAIARVRNRHYSGQAP